MVVVVVKCRVGRVGWMVGGQRQCDGASMGGTVHGENEITTGSSE